MRILLVEDHCKIADFVRRGSNLLVVLAAVLVPRPAWSQTSEPSTITALEIESTIEIDGQLNEPAWALVPRISNFTQRELDFGTPVTERTEVAVLFDRDAFYVGFWGFDREAGRILASEMARDFSGSGDDTFEIVLDPFNDDRNGYLFVVNPNGAMADALIAENGSTLNRDWDGVWEVEARRTGEGWFAEIRIPFSTLRFGPRPEDGWGLNFERNIRRKREQALWQGWSRDFNLEQVSRAGLLTGLHNLGGVTLLEILPHAVGGTEWTPDADRRSVGHLGLDLTYLPAPAFKVNVTVNPDFAQVESDREQVNLTRFSLFYPEKRNFFLEGQEFFDYGLGSDVRPFYSRRIGLAEDRTEIPILGGARVLGKRKNTTLGAMVLQTAREGLNPASNFGVLRWKQDVLDESSVGLLAVSRIASGRTNATYGFDLHYATSEMFGEREFEAGLSLARSFTSDADDRTGTAHRFYVDYPNDLVEFSASWSRAGEAFNPEVGFVRRTAFQRFASELQFNPRPRFLPFLQQVEVKPFEISYYQDDRTGDLQSLFVEFRPLGFTTRSGDQFEFNLQRGAEHLLEPFELFEGAEIPADTYWFTRWELQLESFGGRTVSGELELGGGDFYLGRRQTYAVSGRWKTSKYLTLTTDYEHNRVTLEGDTFLIDEVAGRMGFAFSPKLFGAVAVQWNNEDDEVILNFRLNWIPRPGSDLFLVINEQAETGDASWTPVQTTVLSKLVWRIAL